MHSLVTLDVEEKARIYKVAKKVNDASEKYQLIHAMFAIEKRHKENQKDRFSDVFEEIRNKLCQEIDDSEKEDLKKRVAEVRAESSKNAKITVDYLSQIKYGCARTVSKDYDDGFVIMLPQSMENIRDEYGNINFSELKKLRKLMAHELGHIMLHADSLKNCEKMTDRQEEEADYFAKKLIELRKKRNEEIHKNNNYENI